MSEEEQDDKSDKNIQVFVYNEKEGVYEELILDDDAMLYELLNSDYIFLFSLSLIDLRQP